MDITSKIIAYESGELDDSESLELFQELVATGLAWELQGHYGRAAIRLIESGDITPPWARFETVESSRVSEASN